jgi:hypothetical protein
MSVEMFLWIILGGAATGLVAALLGVGGGFFLVPFLVIFLNEPIHHAIGASLVTMIATSSANAAVNVRRKLTNIRLAMTLELTAAAGAVAGSLTAGLLPGQVLIIVFAGMMITIGLLMMRKLQRGESSIIPISDPGPLGATYYDEAVGFMVTYRVHRLPTVMSVFGVAGVLSGLLGIAGGVIKVPALNLLCKVPTRPAVATANFMAGLTAVAAALVYHARGDVEPLLAAATVLGALAGSALGAPIAARVQSRWVGGIFTVLAFALAFQLLWQAIRQWL